MKIVDSSGWIEFLQGTARAHLFQSVLEDYKNVLVPSICLFEVHRLISKKMGDSVARAAVKKMNDGRVISLDADLAVLASATAEKYKLALADAIIYTTAQSADAQLWTQDAHFKDLPGVRYFPKH